MSKKVLITGGAGFIGSHLCEFLLGKDFEVICVDNLITGRKKNIAPFLKDKRFKFVNHDISRPLMLKEKIDFVLHFASPASPVDYADLPIQTMKVGALGTHNALGIAKKNKARFLLASTSEVYGDPKITPQSEDYWGNVNPIGPRSCYDEAKRFAEALTMAYRNVHQIDTGIVRIFNTYGPRMRHVDGRAIPNFITQALANKPITVYGKGKQTRSFCYISDMIDGLYKLMLSNIHEPVNIGSSDEKSILELAEEILRLTAGKSKLEYNPLPVDDPKVRRPDISRAKEKLSWKPRVGFKDGLKKTIEWFKNE